MFAPPRVCFGEPEGIKASRIARLSHGEGLFHWFHAELQNSDTKGYGHRILLLQLIAGAHRAPLQFRTPTVGAVYDRPGFSVKPRLRINPGMFQALNQS